MDLENASDEGLLEVHSIDVGQGDATLIIGPEGETTLVDVGPTMEARDLVSENIHRRMEARDDVDGLDNIVITHFDRDHVRGASQVAQAHDVNDVYVPNPKTYVPDADQSNTSDIENEALADLDVAGDLTVHSVDTSGVEPSVGRSEEDEDSFNIFADNNINTSVLNPGPPTGEKKGATDRNSGSLAFSIEYDQPDQSGPNPTAVIASDTSVLAAPEKLYGGTKVSYTTGYEHGSESSLRALRQVDPRHVNFSVDPAKYNYGLPDEKMTEEVAKKDMNMTATSMNGTTSFVTDGKSATVLTQREQVIKGSQYNGTEIKDQIKDTSCNLDLGFADEIPTEEPQHERPKPSEVETPDVDRLIFEEGEKLSPDAHIDADVDVPENTRDAALDSEADNVGNMPTWTGKSSSEHPLEELKDVGPKLAEKLDNAGITIDTTANPEELEKIDQIGPELAKKIADQLNSQNENESRSVEPQTFPDEDESHEQSRNRR
jgi:beta-lactamase superfamily II metal-dependent hydrolase/predicted flap endonuclease-1-like 5' DNA nuclease